MNFDSHSLDKDKKMVFTLSIEDNNSTLDSINNTTKTNTVPSNTTEEQLILDNKKLSVQFDTQHSNKKSSMQFDGNATPHPNDKDERKLSTANTANVDKCNKFISFSSDTNINSSSSVNSNITQ